jgi:hypothetical protein
LVSVVEVGGDEWGVENQDPQEEHGCEHQAGEARVNTGDDCESDCDHADAREIGLEKFAGDPGGDESGDEFCVHEMLNAEDDQCERKNAATDSGENGNEILSSRKARGWCWNGSGQHPGRRGEGHGLEGPCAISSAVDYVVQMKGVKK